MLEESGRLAKIVDSLLFLSRADAGKIEIRRERIDLMELAKETAGLIAVLAEDKKQTLAVIGDRPVIVEGDPGLLRQALLNLVDNAIKYSPPGSTIDVCVGMDANRTASLEVRDNGPGIPAADLTRIFERFSRADRTHTHHGAGLGLAIARWAVEANEGTITVRSAEGAGSIFVIRLPLAQTGILGPQSSAASA
ncbi:MAG TPA: HAMP domain-containing sensor histidine kinase [Bacteroidota bacterium]